MTGDATSEFVPGPDLNAILDAGKRIAAWTHRTPVVTCQSLDRALGAKLFLKCENLQKVGAFKFRGATNAVFSLDDNDAARGVATHSSGNHAQALSLAARNRGTKAHIAMPSTSPAAKKAAVREYCGEITECAPTLESRERTLEEIVERTGAVFIHPYDDHKIIAGQATAAVELIEEVPDLDIAMVPVGGGGLLSGTALSFHFMSPGTRVVAAEPKGADDAFRSLEAGRILPSVNPKTVADGLLTSLGSLTFPIIREHVEQIVTVGEDAIIDAMRLVWERAKMIIEPSAAVPIGALLERSIDVRGMRVGIILSGGNVDLDRLPWQHSKKGGVQ